MPREYVYVSNYGQIWRMTSNQWARLVRAGAKGKSIAMPGVCIGSIKAHLHDLEAEDYQQMLIDENAV